MKTICMIPARLGSQRLKKKNLAPLQGQPLIVHAIKKAKESNVFDEIWVNTEADEIGEFAEKEGIHYHKRPEELANNVATSEEFVYQFLKEHPCDYLVQLHSIAPLITRNEIETFTKELILKESDVLLSAEMIQIECSLDGVPVNFTYESKTNSQDLLPIQRISWSITGWKASSYIKAFEEGQCATFSGIVQYFPISKLASHVIKTQEDLDFAEVLFDMVHKNG